MPSSQELLERIQSSDMIYVPGGSTKHAIDTWKNFGIDKMLSDAMEQGKVMTGISAGTVSWFKEGYTDSEKYDVQEGDPWKFGTMDGMNHIDAFVTPHFNSRRTPDQRRRSEHFSAALSDRSVETGLPQYGLGMDNNAGLLAVDGLVRIIATRPTATLHVVRADPSGEVTITNLQAPRLEVSNENSSIENEMSDGISWEDFYTQLSEPAKNPRVTASAS